MLEMNGSPAKGNLTRIFAMSNLSTEPIDRVLASIELVITTFLHH